MVSVPKTREEGGNHTGVVIEEFGPVIPENQKHGTVYENELDPSGNHRGISAPPHHSNEEGNEERSVCRDGCAPGIGLS